MLKQSIKKILFNLFDKIISSEPGRKILDDATRNSEVASRPLSGVQELIGELPYPDLSQIDATSASISEVQPVFITGRFRSGSTLLWNVFRQHPDFTSYYEPFNERRWFDSSNRGNRVDSTHRGVTDYWTEYEGLESLSQWYDESWIRKELYMDEGCWNLRMKTYIQRLINEAPSRPVLQFNRIDFRLPWLRQNFPNAKYIHIYRHPRDQWCSTLMDIECYGPNDGAINDFQKNDKFYLRSWTQDLKYVFPFLEEDEIRHPYQYYYLLWRLSYLFGRKYCDHSICFESLVEKPEDELSILFQALDVSETHWPLVKDIFQQPALQKWKQYASEDWFLEQESACEEILTCFLKDNDLN